jgi:hypothetical protein
MPCGGLSGGGQKRLAVNEVIEFLGLNFIILLNINSFNYFRLIAQTF